VLEERGDEHGGAERWGHELFLRPL